MAHERGWVTRTWLLVVLFAGVAVVRSLQVGIPLRDPHGEIFLTRIAISYGLFVLLVMGETLVRSRGSGRDFRDTLRSRWPRRRIVLALGGLLAYHVVYFSYHNLKSWDVLNQPRDEMLLRWDRWLFLGHSPAVLLHDLLGQGVAAYALLGIYESFSTLVSLALVASIVFARRMRDGYVYVASAIWTWILGVGSYYLIPSLGPFHSAPGDFSGLLHTMIQDTQAKYLGQREHLLANPHAAHAFAQISAFASLHVAVVTLLVLMARYYRLRRLSQVLAVFLAGTVVATVYLGWHFAVDDLAGLVIAVVAYYLGRLTIYPRYQGRPGSVPSHTPAAVTIASMKKSAARPSRMP
jgi:hypothetical protein